MSFLAILSAIAAIMPLIVEIFKEYFSASARARAADQKFILDQITFKAIVDAALATQLASMPKVSQGQGSGWDAADPAKAKTPVDPWDASDPSNQKP